MKRWYKSFAVLAVCLLSFGTIGYLGIQHYGKAAHADNTLTPIDLGVNLTPVGISDSGIVAGNVSDDSNYGRHPVTWLSGAFTDLSSPSGVYGSSAIAISPTGEVIGGDQLTSSNFSATHALKWDSSGSPTDLGGSATGGSCDLSTSGNNASAESVNDIDDIAGFCQAAPTKAGYWPGGTPNTFSQLPDISNGIGWNFATGINHNGDIVGVSELHNPITGFGTVDHATFWKYGTATDVNPSGVYNSYIYAVNNNDLAVGDATFATGFTHAYVWDLASSQTYDLSSISNLSGTAYATGVNNSGVVVGYYFTGTGDTGSIHAFMWKVGDSGITDLNNLLPTNSGWELQIPYGINSSGQIVGTGTLKGQDDAFFINPSTTSSYQLSLAPASQTATIGGGQGLVTATLLDGATNAPASKVKLSFLIKTGPNAGMTGTCFPSSCTTDANGQVDWGYLGSSIGVDTIQVWLDTNGNGSPDIGEPQTTVSVQWTAASLTIHTVVFDWPNWVDPTNLGLVALKITVTNANGTPAKGATVTVSNTNAKFKTNSKGTLTLAERVGVTIDPNVTVQATLGTTSTSTTAQLFSVSGMTECHLPGAPSKIDALTSLIDYLIPGGPIPLLVDRVQKLINWLGGVNTATDLLPDKETTFARAYKYSGSFKSPIYQLQVQIDNNKTGAVIKSFPDAFSRRYALVQPLFTGDGSPLQQIGRSLVCTGPFVTA